MASKKQLLMLVLTLVGFACADNTDAKDSNQTKPDTNANSAELTPNAGTDTCVMIKLVLDFNNTAYTLSSADVNSTTKCINQLVKIRWGKNSTSSISFNFTSDPQAKNFTIDSITLTIGVADNYLNPTDGKPVDLRLDSDEKITAPFGNSYECSTVKYYGPNSGPQLTFTISHVQVEVFRNVSGTPIFGNPIKCEKDKKTNDEATTTVKVTTEEATTTVKATTIVEVTTDKPTTADKPTTDKPTTDKATSDKATNDKATNDKAKQPEGLSAGAITVISVSVILLVSIASIALIVYLRKRRNMCIFGASSRHVAE